MRSPEFFALSTVHETIADTRARLKTGPVETGYARYDTFAQSDAFCVVDGNAVTDCQRSTFVRPFSQTEYDGRPYVEGELMSFDLKMFGGKMPPLLIKEIADPARKEDLIAYEFSLPGPRKTRDVLGYALTDKNHRLIKTHFSGTNAKQNAAFGDLVSRVAWRDMDNDPIPDLAQRFQDFAGQPEAALLFIESRGMKIIDPKVQGEKGTPFRHIRDRGQVYAVPKDDVDFRDSIEANSVETLAAILKLREELNFPQLGTPRPVWAALKQTVTEIGKLWYGDVGGSLKGFETAFVDAKYAVMGIDARSNAWNQTHFAPSEAAMIPYAQTLLTEMDGDAAREMPKSILAQREVLRTALNGVSPDAPQI